jgi:iron complex transport system ATP-binding protein
MTVALDLDDIRLKIGETQVLRGVSLRVQTDDRWVILGANGAGKTTLLRIAALYQHPSSGTVVVLGKRLGRVDVRELRERIAFSSPAIAAKLEPSMTAAEVVMTAKYAALAPWWHRYDDADRTRARSLLERFGCGFLAEHLFPTLSAGERQRVLLARALMRDPELVLLDEPTAGLDIGGREQLLSDLAALASAPAAAPVVLVTHHLEEIPPGFTHALVLRNGETIASGPLAGTLTDAVLTECFGVALRVEHTDDRFTARLAQPGRTREP